MDIMRLTAQELIFLEDFSRLAHEAEEASKLILEKFKTGFGPGNTEIPVYHNETFGEYFADATLSIDGTFRYHDNWWGGRTCTFKCNTEGIFKMLRSCYLRRKQMSEFDPDKGVISEIQEMDVYFADFIKELKEKE